MYCWNIPRAGEHHNESREAKRDGTKSSRIGQPAAEPSPKGAEGSETRPSTLNVSFLIEQFGHVEKKKQGRKPKPFHYKPNVVWPPDEEMKKWYIEGMSTTEIGEKLGRGVSAVWYHLKGIGVETRNRMASTRVHHNQTRSGDASILWDKEKLERLYLHERRSTFEIADMVGCHRQAVVRACHRYDIPMRQAVRRSHGHMVLVEALRKMGVAIADDQLDMRIPTTRFFGDIVFPEERIVIEVDGFFHTKRAVAEMGCDRSNSDRVRQDKIESLGYKVFRIWECDVKKDPTRAALSVWDFLREKAQERSASGKPDDDMVRACEETHEKAG